MNNSQFRKLVLDTPARQSSSSSPSGTQSKNGVQNTPALGSRMRNSIPMTPRTVGGYSSSNEFARQLAERNSSSSTQKKFKSSAAPKGTKFGSGYVDRAKAREGGEGEEDQEDDKVTRVKALEEMMKLGQIDESTFVKLREEILGDEVGMDRAKLVKGLDWRLLERARKGEVGVLDVLERKTTGKVESPEQEEKDEDIDDEFDKLEDKEVRAVVKEKVAKKGEMAPPELTGRKRTRDQILAELKATRLAAKAAAQPSLGAKFKKVGEPRAQSRIERDSKGREVLITIDEHGNEKRKVRKAPLLDPQVEKANGLLMPDKDAKPLGMEVPEIPKAPAEDEEDIDIFDDVGDDYDPLAGLEDDSDSSEEEEGELSERDKVVEADIQEKSERDKDAMPPPPPAQEQKIRNYFGSSSDTGITTTDALSSQPKALNDPTLLAALKKASTLHPISKEPANDEEAARAAKRRKMLQLDDRDAQDMDLGFGSSRFEDEEDMEEKKVKLSQWGADEEDGERGGDGKGKRKRGPKKRKGDGDNSADVLKVLERRKGAGS
ncbi:Uncharacterized protein BP5553_07920 [Venustampulla echinocandica]|uniref:RED-like N-terminal domain-containing protein n=1 Tax=Venustampulla echinocandica TaxID=2656787 RepID=A0A370THW7_9HELO|nr:Uncharacterized protein BP5553_07920 [Venustampulla echinocandica]RDL34792.1 Uncharacterized protein BP5553_07920 [Venustampulla echinocandica]